MLISQQALTIQNLSNDDLPPWDLLLLADPSRSLIEAYLAQGDCFVAHLEGRQIGVFVLIAIDSDSYELKNIAVAEAEQGQGIGKLLLQAAIQETKSRGGKKLLVGTGNSSLKQLAFYQKCDFRIVGVEPDFFVHHYDEPIIENGIRCLDMVRLSLSL